MLCFRYIAFICILYLLSFAAIRANAGQLEDGQTAYLRGDFETGIKLLVPLADQGSADAAYELGQIYDAKVPKESSSVAENWYRRAAYQGNPDAQIRLGQIYGLGEGVKRDYSEAYYWYSLAALTRSSAAKLRDNIANNLTKVQLNAANKRLQLRVEVLRDEHWKRLLGAVSHGDTQALTSLKTEAEHGSLRAQNSLAYYYINDGMGQHNSAQRNNIQAIKWFGMSAAQGDLEAMHNLFNIYISGIDVPRDDMKAYFWGRLFLDQGVKRQVTLDREFEAVKERLSPTQIDDVEGQVQKWMKVHPEPRESRGSESKGSE
ncbi:MAG: msfA [Bryobacterales bacterium]|nr:msfA [Bryobacterales bacterium]